MENHISDRYLIFTVLKLKLPKPQPTYVIARSYKHYDPVRFVEDLAQVPWLNNLLIDDVNEKLDHFNCNFLGILDRHAPIKTMKIRYRQCPFVDEEIKNEMNRRDHIHKIARQTNNALDWESFRLSREEVKKKLRDAEKAYVQNEIHNNQKPNAMWKVIRNCIPRKEVSQPVYSRDMKELADEFFTSVGAKAAEESKKLAAEYNLPLMQPKSPVPIHETDEFHFH